MADLNRASLRGRIGQDPEIRTTQTGEKIANFSIATGEQWADKNTGEKRERTEWHRVVAFGRLAEFAEKYLRKGARVCVEGAIRTRKWQDQNGQDRWSTEIVLSGFGSSIDPIDWPDSGGAARGQDDSYGGGQLPPGPDGGGYDQGGGYGGDQGGSRPGLDDDEIPF
ncbi:single-stranded DNA-binding protein [Celeribacter naphthalenivorans]|uniref:single-stranded DNA-binding protein n=1 Tax=Celeribacter naphthalenivorans TaxID=1614694 RepID=UPI001CFA1F76|nr:single-stranded DNA-binding protein [Celeribacter naphthalenivorans]